MQYGTAYNRGLLFSLRPNIDVERLELAWSTAIDLHSSVKTRIVKASDGKVETRVDPDFKPNVRVMMMDVAEWERLRPRLVAPVDMNMDNDFYRVIIAMVKTPAGVDKYLFIRFLKSSGLFFFGKPFSQRRSASPHFSSLPGSFAPSI